jgi:DNA-binding NarL/FixJ family response regulator
VTPRGARERETTDAAGPRAAASAGAPSGRRLRVVLVDDHNLVREGLRHVLELQPDIVVTGESAGPAEAFDLLADDVADIVLLDLTYPDADGLAVLRELSSRRPELRLIVLTMHRDAETVRQAFRAGAAGYVVKGARTSELVEAIRAVARGERYLHSSVAGAVIDDSLRWMDAGHPLSAREREILAHIAAGKSAAETGRALGISPFTVRRHVANLSAKLGLRGPQALTRYGIEHGLVRDG